MALRWVRDAFLVAEGPETLVAMGMWCGAYSCLHHGLYAASYVWWSKRTELDAPNAKYWNSSMRRVTTARVVALTHALASWLWSVRVLVKGGLRLDGALLSSRPWLRYDALNSLDSVRFMRHSLGYFVQELAHVILHEPDPIFIAHHILYLASTFPICALSTRGWPLIAVATALAEATNPLQLLWEMAKAFGHTDLYDSLSLPFTLSFVLCRGILMPIFMLDMANFIFLSPEMTTSDGGRVIRSTYYVFIGGLAASVSWLINLIRGFARYRAKKNRRLSSDDDDTKSPSNNQKKRR